MKFVMKAANIKNISSVPSIIHKTIFVQHFPSLFLRQTLRIAFKEIKPSNDSLIDQNLFLYYFLSYTYFSITIHIVLRVSS